MCTAVHWKERWDAIKEEIQLGSGLEGQHRRVLNVVSKHVKCFPSDGKLGSTSLVEFSTPETRSHNAQTQFERHTVNGRSSLKK